MRRVVVKPLAQADERRTLSHSTRTFGAAAARAYAAMLKRAYKLLRTNPRRPGVQLREELPGAPCVFHLRHARTRGTSPKQPRHFIVFTYDDETVTVVRVLHDAMDLPGQLSEPEDE